MRSRSCSTGSSSRTRRRRSPICASSRSTSSSALTSPAPTRCSATGETRADPRGRRRDDLRRRRRRQDHARDRPRVPPGRRRRVARDPGDAPGTGPADRERRAATDVPPQAAPQARARGPAAPIDGRILVFERPWGEFTLADEDWRDRLAEVVAEHEIDVLIAGPLTRIGMDAAGTLHEVGAFMALVDDVRRLLRPAADGRADPPREQGAARCRAPGRARATRCCTSQARGNGHTVVYVQKARWDPSVIDDAEARVGRRRRFELEADRDLPAEVKMFLAEHPLADGREIAASQDADPPGSVPTGTRSRRLWRAARRSSTTSRATMRRPPAGVPRRSSGGGSAPLSHPSQQGRILAS